jgi:hypothetical protein
MMKPPKRLFKRRPEPERANPIRFAASVACVSAFNEGVRGDEAIRFRALMKMEEALAGDAPKKTTKVVDGKEELLVDTLGVIYLAINSPAQTIDRRDKDRLREEFNRAITWVFTESDDWRRHVASRPD